jgi:transcriptional regulator with PAS, ATPase and Fis domain
MPMEMQAKLLRVLEAKEFERIGGNTKINLDARIIAATNENIEDEIQKGRFREDLYYRLNVITIDIPPLRDRREDIEPLAEDILDTLANEMKVGKKILTDETLKILRSYNWPGNVRELRNILERAINLSTKKEIVPENIAERVLNKVSYNLDLEQIKPLKDIMEETEIEAIKNAIISSKGNKTLAAEKLGIHRTALYKKINKYKMEEYN